MDIDSAEDGVSNALAGRCRRGVARLSAASLLLAGMAVALSGAHVARALSVTTCSGGTTASPTVITGTVSGNLDVTGQCKLDHARVMGGVTVEPGAGLEMENSTVNRSVTVGSGGELDLGHGLSSQVETGSPNTVHGSVTLSGPVDMDLRNATIDGALAVTDSTFAPSVCGTHIRGNVSITGGGDILVFGDPPRCGGNTVGGALTLRNLSTASGASQVEGNSIFGAVTIDNSAVDFRANSVGGRLACVNGGALAGLGNPRDASLPPNSVRGTNTC